MAESRSSSPLPDMVGPDDVGIDWAGEPGAMAAEPRNSNAVPGGNVSGMDEEGGEEEAEEEEEVERAVTPPLANQFERVAPSRPLKQRPSVLDPLRNAQSMGLRRLKPRVRKMGIADAVCDMVQRLGVDEDGAGVDNVLMIAFRNRMKRRRDETDERGMIPAARQFRAASRAALPAAGPDLAITYDFGQGAAAGAAETPGRPAAGAAEGGTADNGSQWNLRERQEYGSDGSDDSGGSGEDSE